MLCYCSKDLWSCPTISRSDTPHKSNLPSQLWGLNRAARIRENHVSDILYTDLNHSQGPIFQFLRFRRHSGCQPRWPTSKAPSGINSPVVLPPDALCTEPRVHTCRPGRRLAFASKTLFYGFHGMIYLSIDYVPSVPHVHYTRIRACG